MNNAVYYEYVDSVVNAWLIRTGALDLPDGPVIGLVVETGCVFHAGLGFPGGVDAGLRVRRIGRSSVTYEVGLFAEGAQLASAEAHFTHVCVDRVTRRPVPLPDRLRDALGALRVAWVQFGRSPPGSAARARAGRSGPIPVEAANASSSDSSPRRKSSTKPRNSGSASPARNESGPAPEAAMKRSRTSG